VKDPHLQTLEERRLELVGRSTAQRAAIVANVAPIAARTAALDRALGTVRRHPVLVAAVAAAATLIGGRRLFGLVARGVTLFALMRKL